MKDPTQEQIDYLDELTGHREVVITKSSRGSQKRLYAYSIDDLCLLFGMDLDVVETTIGAGRFELGDLESICLYWLQRMGNPNFVRRWPTTHEERLKRWRTRVDAEKKTKTRTKIKYKDQAGKEKMIRLPDPRDL